MAIKVRSFAEMTADSVDYLQKNTDVTYLARGGIARGLLDATNLEIARLQDFVLTSYSNAYLTTARGIYLDLFGDMLGLTRVSTLPAEVRATDSVIRFYVKVGTLGSKLPHPSDTTKGLVPAATLVYSLDRNITFSVTEAQEFPVNAKSTYVSAKATIEGAVGNVGVNQLTSHSLGDSSVFVTNDSPVTTGTDIESDEEYRFRLSKALTTRAGSNQTTIQVAALSQPGVVRAELIPFARGSGTFDVVLIPRGNRVSRDTIESVRRAVEASAAYGISAKIREPEYLPVRLTARVSFNSDVQEGRKQELKSLSEAAILRYMASIEMGGEFITNQVEASVLNVSMEIKDVSILELCVGKKARGIRNFKLAKDELVVPDRDSEDPILVV